MVQHQDSVATGALQTKQECEEVGQTNQNRVTNLVFLSQEPTCSAVQSKWQTWSGAGSERQKHRKTKRQVDSKERPTYPVLWTHGLRTSPALTSSGSPILKCRTDSGIWTEHSPRLFPASAGLLLSPQHSARLSEDPACVWMWLKPLSSSRQTCLTTHVCSSWARLLLLIGPFTLLQGNRFCHMTLWLFNCWYTDK